MCIRDSIHSFINLYIHSFIHSFIHFQSNPPRLYSHLKFISNFLTVNEQTLNNGHRLSNAVPRLFGTVVDCCFTNIQVAVTTIKNMEANEEKNEIKYGSKHHTDYLSAQVCSSIPHFNNTTSHINIFMHLFVRSFVRSFA